MFVMRQSRLESFFEIPPRPPPQPGLGLLDLPPSIRQLIYKHAGLVDQTIDLNYSNLLVYPYKQYPDSCFAVRLRCAHSALPIVRRRDDSAPIGEEEYWELDEEEWELETTEPQLLSVDRCVECSDGRGLLFVSKRISREVVPFVYANNIFTVRQEAPHGLKRVKMIGVDGMAALTSLTMKIGKKEGRLRFDANHVNDSPPQPLHLGQKSSRTSMEDYEAVIERLAKHVRPRKLAMFLILGAPNLHILHQVLRPLFQMPTLKHCGLWSFVRPQISRAVEYNTIPGRFTLTEDAPPLTPRTSFQIPTAPIEEATSILEFATRKLTSGANEIGAGFRYLDLPAELRLHILGYTDLVSSKDVQWRPKSRIQLACFCNINFSDECSCYGVPTYYPAEEGEAGQLPFLCCQECRPTTATPRCFCSHKDFGRSTTCACPSTRSALFSVSREVRQDAIAIYYSLNRIIVTPIGSQTMVEFQQNGSSWPLYGTPGMRHTELSLYLSSLARNALQYIRWLEWLHPPPSRDYLLPNTPAWFDYLDTLDMMRNAMNIKNLTFVLNMGAETYLCSWLRHGPRHWYKQVALAVLRLGPLKDCFIYLGHSVRHIEDRDRSERSLEKEIMGTEYDSGRRAKPKEKLAAIFERYQDLPE